MTNERRREAKLSLPARACSRDKGYQYIRSVKSNIGVTDVTVLIKFPLTLKKRYSFT